MNDLYNLLILDALVASQLTRTPWSNAVELARALGHGWLAVTAEDVARALVRLESVGLVWGDGDRGGARSRDDVPR